MSEEDKKLKASENKAKDIETKPKRKELAAELGENILVRAKLAEQVRQIDARNSQIAQQMEALGNG